MREEPWEPFPMRKTAHDIAVELSVPELYNLIFHLCVALRRRKGRITPVRRKVAVQATVMCLLAAQDLQMTEREIIFMCEGILDTLGGFEGMKGLPNQEAPSP